MFENAMGLLLNIGFGDTASKVDGRINYVVRVEKNKGWAYTGTQKAMRGCRLYSSELISIIIRDGVSWVKFTYKKDLHEYLNALKEAGFRIITV